jgi:hypothetical protein
VQHNDVMLPDHLKQLEPMYSCQARKKLTQIKENALEPVPCMGMLVTGAG